MQDLKQEMNQMRHDLGIVQKVYCTPEEQEVFTKLGKEGKRISGETYGEVFYDGDSNKYYRNIEADLPREDLEILLAYRQITNLRTIKYCLIFIVAMIILSLVIGFFGAALRFQ